MDKNSSDKTSWLLTKKFYAVIFSVLLAIAGVSTAIYNVSKRSMTSDSNNTTHYTVPTEEKTTEEFRANANATGIPDERTTMPTTKTTHNDLNMPYSGYYLLPVNNSICKDYSNGAPVYSETMGDWREHSGIDIKATIGENVLSVQDGTVKEVISDDLWGGTVIIEHGNGLTVKYCGIKSTVAKDLPVEQGEVIGTVVAIPIEAKDGIHIHLETIIDNKNVDPIKALNLLEGDKNNVNE